MGSKESKEAEVESPGDTQVSKADIQAEVAASMIVIYVSKSCPYCQVAIKALSASGFEAKIIDANTSQKSVLKEMTGSTSLPSCWVKGKFVGGCNDGPESWMGIAKMVKSGKLTELMSAQ